MAGVDQTVEHLEHARVDIAAGDWMLGALQDTGLGMSLQNAVAGINHQGLAQSSTRDVTLSSGPVHRLLPTAGYRSAAADAIGFAPR